VPDTPMLVYEYKNERRVVDLSHRTDADLLKIPGFGESWWRYTTTTSEMIPVFVYDDRDVDIETFVNSLGVGLK
jgi:hypothetical protein